jgi:triosephosphate isomerase
MSSPRKPLIAGNWKMNLTAAKARELVHAVLPQAERTRDAVDVAVFPTALHVAAVAAALGGDADQPAAIAVGVQNLHTERSGAFTGEISGPMARDAGATLALCGHSERRQLFGETPAFVGAKVAAALRDGLTPVLCVGETLDERDAGATIAVVTEQLAAVYSGLLPGEAARVVIAYEPVWAIGTGRNATPAQAGEVHAAIRGWLAAHVGAEVAASTRILYGGSVKADNADALLSQPDVDGALVGGASLDAASFGAIIRAARARAA